MCSKCEERVISDELPVYNPRTAHKMLVRAVADVFQAIRRLAQSDLPETTLAERRLAAQLRTSAEHSVSGLAPSAEVTVGRLLRAAAEKFDRLDDAAGTLIDDGTGYAFTREELYPYVAAEYEPSVCPLCASDRAHCSGSSYECEADNESWLCDACGNDVERAKAVMARRRVPMPSTTSTKPTPMTMSPEVCPN